VKVLVPQPEFAAALADLAAPVDRAAPADLTAPAGPATPPGRALEVLVWSGAGSPPEDLTGIEFHVPAYTFDSETLEVMADMPDLRVVQLLTAGVEHVLRYLPAGVTLCNARGVHDASAAAAVALALASLRAGRLRPRSAGRSMAARAPRRARRQDRADRRFTARSVPRSTASWPDSRSGAPRQPHAEVGVAAMPSCPGYRPRQS
jgi:hypothetical protein